MELLNKENIVRVNWVVKLKSYVTFEFLIKDDLYVDEAGSEFDLFRLFIHTNGDSEIMVANREDYDIHEDVSYAFDIDDIKDYCLSIEDLHDATNDYIEDYKHRARVEDIDLSDMIPAVE